MPTPLDLRTRADLFSQLAAMETAGLPFDQALGLLRLPAAVQPRVATMRRLLAKGAVIARAGEASGMFTALDANLVNVAASAGSPARIFRRLGEHYTQKAAQAASIKSRMAMPAFMLIAALLIQPLPRLISGALPLGSYLLQSVGALVVLACIAWLFAGVPTWLHNGPASGVRAACDRLLRAVPLFGAMYVRRNVRDFFESLGLMLDAGLPMLDALPKAVNTVQNRTLRKEFSRIKPRIENGASLAQALTGLAFLEGGQALDLVHTGEQSGTLPDMLFRFAAAETADINQFHQQVAEWLPRLVYALVAGWIAYGVLSGNTFGPQVPTELR